MGKLEGKIALITGGNSGIGLATAKRFVNEGAYVYILGRRDAEISKTVDEIGANVAGVQGDVTNLADLDRLFAQVKQDRGRLDVVFANAGVYPYARIGEITVEHYETVFNVNVKGVLFTVQKALDLMPDGASIVLTGSVAGSKGFADQSVYSATKAAVRSFARCWTTELRDRRIRVNVVSPGPIETPGLQDMIAAPGGEEFLVKAKDAIPLGRLGTAGEIANAVVFLASDEASFITGIELFVDGGIGQI